MSTLSLTNRGTLLITIRIYAKYFSAKLLRESSVTSESDPHWNWGHWLTFEIKIRLGSLLMCTIKLDRPSPPPLWFDPRDTHHQNQTWYSCCVWQHSTDLYPKPKNSDIGSLTQNRNPYRTSQWDCLHTGRWLIRTIEVDPWVCHTTNGLSN